MVADEYVLIIGNQLLLKLQPKAKKKKKKESFRLYTTNEFIKDKTEQNGLP